MLDVVSCHSLERMWWSGSSIPFGTVSSIHLLLLLCALESSSESLSQAKLLFIRDHAFLEWTGSLLAFPPPLTGLRVSLL